MALGMVPTATVTNAVANVKFGTGPGVLKRRLSKCTFSVNVEQVEREKSTQPAHHSTFDHASERDHHGCAETRRGDKNSRASNEKDGQKRSKDRAKNSVQK